MFDAKEKETVLDYLDNMEVNSSVYIGCDSVRFKKKGQWFARYTVAFIIHKGSKHGGKIFHFTEVERVFDPKASKPRMRLMREVQLAVDTYTAFEEELIDIDVSIHLDINSDKNHNSNLVMKEALGYVMGMTGIAAEVKPNAWAASHAGDRGARGMLE